MLVLIVNTAGLGEQRPVRTGTLGRVPVENMLGEVLAVPNQDAFAAGSDSCFLVMQPGMKTGGVNLWAHWVRSVFVAGEGVGRTVRKEGEGVHSNEQWCYAGYTMAVLHQLTASRCVCFSTFYGALLPS